MITLITLAILTSLLLVGCADISIIPINSDNHSISDDVDITMTVNDAYASVIFTPHIIRNLLQSMINNNKGLLWLSI